MAKSKASKVRKLHGFDLETYTIQSSYLADSRRIRVLLPKKYNENKRVSYPVIYMLDGQNLFYDAEAYAGISWRVSETLAEYPSIPDLIVVGIDNSADRLTEYSPWTIKLADENSELNGKGGGGARQAEFIMQEVKPFIDENYRTEEDALHTALIASSLGASLAAYMGLEYSDKIGALGVFSLVNFMFGSSFKRYIAGKDLNPEQKIYIQVGTEETEGNEINAAQKLISRQAYVDSSLDYYHKLLYKGASLDNLALHIYVGEGHNEEFWAKHLVECLLFISADW